MSVHPPRVRIHASTPSIHFSKSRSRKTRRIRERVQKKTENLNDNDIILFQDEASIQISPTITRMWSLKGHQPEISTFGGRKRQHLIGAVEPLSGRVHIAFSEAMKAKQFEHFLVGLLARYKDAGKILLILDNARAHHSKELKPFLKINEEKLELMFLPPYSPDMNPMEWFWKLLRNRVTHNTFFGTFKEFQRALIKFIIKYKLPTQEIKTRCNFSKVLSSS